MKKTNKTTEEEFNKLPENTRKSLEEAGITFEVYEQMFEILQQVEEQMSGVAKALGELNNDQV